MPHGLAHRRHFRCEGRGRVALPPRESHPARARARPPPTTRRFPELDLVPGWQRDQFPLDVNHVHQFARSRRRRGAEKGEGVSPIDSTCIASVAGKDAPSSQPMPQSSSSGPVRPVGSGRAACLATSGARPGGPARGPIASTLTPSRATSCTRPRLFNSTGQCHPLRSGAQGSGTHCGPANRRKVKRRRAFSQWPRTPVRGLPDALHTAERCQGPSEASGLYS